ncbi:hypothetical protein AGLY_007987 [Aphis glycines]|uniref:Uncharacterized protein n=1 Tax=Aphis glycines TaxID=307491 RepID=A0A6G0TLW2_APHGL|nr:hypothetical protein AGLY_007987 [Aphis glycines]
MTNHSVTYPKQFISLCRSPCIGGVQRQAGPPGYREFYIIKKQFETELISKINLWLTVLYLDDRIEILIPNKSIYTLNQYDFLMLSACRSFLMIDLLLRALGPFLQCSVINFRALVIIYFINTLATTPCTILYSNVKQYRKDYRYASIEYFQLRLEKLIIMVLSQSKYSILLLSFMRNGTIRTNVSEPTLRFCQSKIFGACGNGAFQIFRRSVYESLILRICHDLAMLCRLYRISDYLIEWNPD